MLNIHRLLSSPSNINGFLEVQQIWSIGANWTALSKFSNKSKRSKRPRISKKSTNVKMDSQKNYAVAAASAVAGCSKLAQNGSGRDSVSKESNDNMRTSFRQWEEVAKPGAQSTNVSGNSFTIMSYNILSQHLLESHPYLYTNHTRTALNWKFRLERLKEEILHVRPDILCLQEVEMGHLEMILDSLKVLKFDHVYKQKTGDRTDGCAIFYNRNQFTLLERHSVEYFQPEIEQLNRDNIAIIAKLCFKSEPSSCFIVATTHLLYNPRRQDVRLAQIQVLLAELDKISYNGLSSQGLLKRLPIIVTGDFNLQPHSAPHRLITRGTLYYYNLTARQLEGPVDEFARLTGKRFLPPMLGITDNCQHFNRSRLKNSEIPNLTAETAADNRSLVDETFVNEHSDNFASGRLTHSLNLTSVYPHRKTNGQQEVSTFQERWVTVDYIFYSQPHACCPASKSEGTLQLLSRYVLPSVDQCHAMGLIPNMLLGSDHLSLAARFLFTPKL